MHLKSIESYEYIFRICYWNRIYFVWIDRVFSIYLLSPIAFLRYIQLSIIYCLFIWWFINENFNNYSLSGFRNGKHTEQQALTSVEVMVLLSVCSAAWWNCMSKIKNNPTSHYDNPIIENILPSALKKWRCWDVNLLHNLNWNWNLRLYIWATRRAPQHLSIDGNTFLLWCLQQKGYMYDYRDDVLMLNMHSFYSWIITQLARIPLSSEEHKKLRRWCFLWFS